MSLLGFYKVVNVRYLPVAEKTTRVGVKLPALQAVNDLGSNMLVVWVVEIRLQRHLAM